MKDFSKATPRPWQQNFLKSFIETSDKTKYICEMSVNENDVNFSYDEYKQNGELIVTAVNNYDKMKEIIEEVNHELVEFGGVGMDTHSRIVLLLKQLETK